MSLSLVFSLFLAHFAIGITWTLLRVSRAVGVKFFRFNAGLATVLLAIALAFRPSEVPPCADQQLYRLGWIFLVATIVPIAVYWVTVGRGLISVRRLLLWGASVSGAAAISLEALSVAATRPLAIQLLSVPSFLTSSALLGGACTAMILGHWYLILPSMSVNHLQSMVKFHIVSIVLRSAIVLAAVVVAVGWSDAIAAPPFQRYVLSLDGVFFWQRVLFGLVGPAILAYLTWETAKIQSTQSATGILYVDLFTVIVGELLSKYVTLATAVPV